MSKQDAFAKLEYKNKIAITLMEIKTAKVLITGGSTGIGYETAKLLKENRATVFICSRTAQSLEKAITTLNVYGTVADVSNEEDVARLIDEAIAKMDGLNVIINNAGIGRMASLTDTTIADFKEVWQTNVLGSFLVAKYAAKHFIKHNYGNIINIGSTAAQKGFAGGTSYASSKFAVSGMTQSWQAELRKHNIRVMQVNPSEVITPFLEKIDYTANNPETKLKPTEIAHTILSMLAMNDVGFVNTVTVWATNP